MEKVDGDHASWWAGGGAQATRALLLAGYFWAQLLEWTLVATWSLEGFRPIPPVKDRKYSKPRDLVTLGR